VNRERLTEKLEPRYRETGFYLEDDEDFLYLEWGERVVAVWNAAGATLEAVQAEADRQMAEAHN